MRIVWVCGARILGGAERATLAVAQRWHGSGHTVEILCRPHSPLSAAAREEGLVVVPAPLGGTLNVRSFYALARACRDSAPAVVLVSTVDEWIWSSLVRRMKPQLRLVLVRHMALPLSRVVARLANRHADAIVAVSEAVRQRLLADGRIHPERVRVIHSACRFAPRAAPATPDERRRARSAFGLDLHSHWVGFFGGLDPAKGISDVLHAVRRANDELGPTRLLACGGGPRHTRVAEVLQQVSALGLEDRFRYLGQIDKVADAMVAVDAVVMATRHALGEGFGLSLVEAMACGTPVLAYATGGMAEVIGEDGTAGLLAPPDDTAELGRLLIRLLADTTTAEQLAAQALRRVRDLFLPERAAEQYERIFFDLWRGPGSSGSGCATPARLS